MRERRRRKKVARTDGARPWQRGFQEAGTPIAEGIIRFHHDLMVVMVMVATFVAWMMGRCVHHFEESKNGKPSDVVHGTRIEVVWTIVPLLCVVLLLFLLLLLLYILFFFL